MESLSGSLLWMTRLKSVPLLGFSGKILTAVMIGGALAFVLDPGSTLFGFSHDKFAETIRRIKIKGMFLTNAKSRSPSNSLHKRVKGSLFMVDISGKEINLLDDYPMILLILHPFNIYP